MKYFSILTIVFCLLLMTASAQTNNPIGGIGSWRIHLPYNNGLIDAIGNDRIYCATNFGLFSYKPSDGSIQRYSKVNGLSDLEISTIRFSMEDHVLLVAYKNSNIDFVYDDNSIYNLPDIKQKDIIGGKAINQVIFLNHFAYLSCQFGIVVLNLDKKETKDTYYIGKVNALAADNQKFYAATDSGIYSNDITSQFLGDPQSWTKDTTVPNHNSVFTSIASFNGKLFVVHGDTAKYVYDGTTWSYFNSDFSPSSHFNTDNGYLIYTNNHSVNIFDWALNNIAYFDANSYTNAAPVFSAIDVQGVIWIADGNNGLVRCQPPASSGQYQVIQPNGPAGLGAFDMGVGTKGVWVASVGLVFPSSSCEDNPTGVYWFNNNEWKSFYQQNDPVYNSLSQKSVVDVAVDPKNGSHAFVGTCRNGLLEFRESGIIKVYDSTNSPIQPIRIYNTSDVWIGGVQYDANGNLWIISNLNNEQLTELKTDGTWKSFHLGSSYFDKYMFNLLIDNYNQKWVNIRGLGLLVYQENDPDNPNDDNVTLVNATTGHGGLPSVAVHSIAQDKDGAIWIGSDQGVAVIYNPGNVFSGSNYDAQKILILQDTHYQYLLETEDVTAIAVDGANRKWFGTFGSGVYLMSADGTKEIYHFDTDNSPLLDNWVKTIAIDPLTGEVFFGTNNGICSFRSDATEGGDVCDNYYVFPNPIRHEYHGPIAINGLVADASVKITDVSGQLVYQTKAAGGQAIWNGNNFSGERAHTGVYIVYVTNDDGSATCVTKMLFSN